jgi:uncharacterized protein
MLVDKAFVLPASREQLWALLLDPVVMTRCVPGMTSMAQVSPSEYIATMQVKLSFISANFKIRTVLNTVEPPSYLASQGQGEDKAVVSSFKQSSEMFLHPHGEGQTEFRFRATIDVLGRLGSFGLAAMRTKADRMWDELGENLRKECLALPAPSTPPQ